MLITENNYFLVEIASLHLGPGSPSKAWEKGFLAKLWPVNSSEEPSPRYLLR